MIFNHLLRLCLLSFCVNLWIHFEQQTITLGNYLGSLFHAFATYCIWRGCQQRAFSLTMFDIMYTILTWLVVCRTTRCLMKSESIERYTPYPRFVCSAFSLTIHLWESTLFDLLFCFTKWRTLLTHLLFRHELPIDEHLKIFN